MEQTEIIEGNKLIAEFMQLKKLTETTWINPVLACSVNCLAYNESWGWLMPVVEKISSIEFHREMQDLGNGELEEVIHTHYPRTFGMPNQNGKIMVRLNACTLVEADTLIEATYLAVVDFIKNNNNSKQQTN